MASTNSATYDDMSEVLSLLPPMLSPLAKAQSMDKSASLTSHSSLSFLKCHSSMGSISEDQSLKLKHSISSQVPIILAKNASVMSEDDALGLFSTPAAALSSEDMEATVVSTHIDRNETNDDGCSSNNAISNSASVELGITTEHQVDVNEDSNNVNDAMEVDEQECEEPVPSGSVPSSSNSIQPMYLGPPPIEIVISFDTTGSMSYYLDEVKSQIQDIIQRLFMDIPSLKIGIVAHGDYCDEKVFYLTQKMEFTNDVNALCQFVKDVEGTGGGDFEECYELILSEIRSLPWSPGAQRSLVMIGDAIPHEPDYALNKDNLDWRKEASALYDEMGVRVYAVQCQDEKGASAFWEELASLANGRHLKLDQFGTIVDILMAICYREQGAEHFDAYEKEVRSRKNGTNLPQELDSAFNVLRGKPCLAPAFDWSKGASKKPKTVRRNVNADVNPGTSSSTGLRKLNRRIPVKKLTKVAKNVSVKRSVMQLRARKTKPSVVPILLGKRYRSKREHVPQTKYLLRELKWSQWQLGMSPTGMDTANWKPRRNGCSGFRNVRLFKSNCNQPAIYEFAVQKQRGRKKYVMHCKVTKGFAGRCWDTVLLNSDRTAQHINSCLNDGCNVFIRRALIPKSLQVGSTTLKTVKDFRIFLNQSYQYAWSFKGQNKNGCLPISKMPCDCVMCWQPKKPQ